MSDRPSVVPRLLDKQSVSNDQSSHGLDDRQCSRRDRWVVSSLGGQNTVLTVVCGGVLFLGDGGHGLERHREVDVLAVGDTALDTSRVVGAGAQSLCLLVVVECVVVLGPRDARPRETGTDFEPLGSRDGEHGVSEHRLELVEARLTESRWNVTHHTGDDTADGVLLAPVVLDLLDHLCGESWVRTADEPDGVYLGASNSVQGVLELLVERVSVHADGPDLGHKRNDLYTARLLQKLLGDGTRSDTTNGLPGGGSTTTGGGLDTVLLGVSVVSVGWARVRVHLRIVVRSVVLVVDHHRNGGAERLAVLGTGLYVDPVLLVTWGGQLGLAGSASGQLWLDVVCGEGHAGRHTVDDAANGLAVGLTVGGDAEQFTEGGHGEGVWVLGRC